MLKRMIEILLHGAAIVDLVLSGLLAKLLVIGFGWRWVYLVDAPLDASASILGYWMVLGVALPPILLLALVVFRLEFIGKSRTIL